MVRGDGKGGGEREREMGEGVGCVLWLVEFLVFGREHFALARSVRGDFFSQGKGGNL